MSVGFNATPAARAVATHGGDLRVALLLDAQFSSV